jgi:hypothetical protein
MVLLPCELRDSPASIYNKERVARDRFERCCAGLLDNSLNDKAGLR